MQPTPVPPSQQVQHPKAMKSFCFALNNVTVTDEAVVRQNNNEHVTVLQQIFPKHLILFSFSHKVHQKNNLEKKQTLNTKSHQYTTTTINNFHFFKSKEKINGLSGQI